MSVLAEAIDDLFADPNLGLTATYTPPGGVAQAVTALLRRAETADGAFLGPGLRLSSAAQAAAVIAEIRRGEIAAPAKGAAIVVEGIAYTVTEVPELDPARLVWRLPLRKA